MENNQTASRDARRFLSDRVRDDWDWPNTPECWSASDEEVRGITEFRERYYGSSASDDESEAEAGAADPYKFDSPDSIGDAVEMKMQSRKRKRQAGLETEMAWNEGLACFVQRRDVWTGAAAVKKYGTKRPAKNASPAEAGSAPETDTDMADRVQPTETEPSSSNSKPPQPALPLVPIAHPLLADNAIRKSISSKAYPDIYNKIVVSSRSPSVPINLADMTKALVQGWKDNGEWPPKATPLDPLVGRKRGLVSVKMEAGDGAFLSHHPHVKKGMDSVKRILHLNGYHHDHGHGVGING